MRTNIMLDENLIERAKKLTGIKTKREVVQEALRTLILLCEQAEVGGSANQVKGFRPIWIKRSLPSGLMETLKSSIAK